MSAALTFSWTSKNNCRTAGTKVYKYQPQFINTELRVITGLTNIKRGKNEEMQARDNLANEMKKVEDK